MKKIIHIVLFLASLTFLLNSVEAGEASKVHIEDQEVTFSLNIQGQKVVGSMELQSGILDLTDDFITNGLLEMI